MRRDLFSLSVSDVLGTGRSPRDAKLDWGAKMKWGQLWGAVIEVRAIDGGWWMEERQDAKRWDRNP